MQKQSKSMLVSIKQSFCAIFICLFGALMMAVLFLAYLPFLVINPYKKFVKWLENIISLKMETL